MLPVENLLWGVALPFAAILIVAFLARRVADSTRGAPRFVSGELAVFAATIAIASFAQIQWTFVPEESVHWLPWVFTALAVLAAFEGASFGASRGRLVVRLAILSFGLLRLLGRRFETEHPGIDGELRLAALALGAFLAAEFGGVVARHLESPIAECAWVAAFAAEALFVVAARSVTLALYPAVFAAALGAFAVVGFVRRAEPSVRAALGRFAGAACVLVAVESRELARPEYSVWLWSLLALGVVAPLAIQFGPARRWKFSARFVAAALCALVPTAIAVAIVLEVSGGLTE